MLLAGLGAGGVLVLGLIVAFTFGGSGPDAEDKAGASSHDATSCEDLAALAGDWVFATRTTGARVAKRLGMRGYYELRIGVQDCKGEAHLTKVGRTGRKHFQPQQLRKASAALAPGEGARAFGFSGSFELKDAEGRGGDQQFTFTLEGDRLVGSWRQRGIRWKNSGLYGVLEGMRAGDPRELKPRRNSVPCVVQCAAPKTVDEITDEDPTAVEACRAAC